jgi:hypothetical protein
VPGGPSHSDHERIETVEFPLDRIEDAIARCEDAASLVGLLLLRSLL